MESVLARGEVEELKGLLLQFSAKLDLLLPTRPSERNTWWRRPLHDEVSNYRSFNSLKMRQNRRDKHWATFAGKFDCREEYLFHLRKPRIEAGKHEVDIEDSYEVKGVESQSVVELVASDQVSVTVDVEGSHIVESQCVMDMVTPDQVPVALEVQSSCGEPVITGPWTVADSVLDQTDHLSPPEVLVCEKSQTVVGKEIVAGTSDCLSGEPNSNAEGGVSSTVLYSPLDVSSSVLPEKSECEGCIPVQLTHPLEEKEPPDWVKSFGRKASRTVRRDYRIWAKGVWSEEF
jgi:hypothetical protein